MAVDIENEIDDVSLQYLYAWIDSIPLSRKKRNLTRDFGDGVLVAEIVKYYFPSMVELHNYPSVNSLNQKLINWETLNKRVLSKISYSVPPKIMKQIVESSHDAVQTFLLGLMQKIETQLIKKGLQDSSFTLKPKNIDFFKPKSQNVSSVVMPSNINKNLLNNQNLFTKPTSILKNANSGFDQIDCPRRSLVPISKLNLMTLDSETRMLLEEKEQAWDFLQDAVRNLEEKVQRLEHLLHLKDLRLQDLQNRISAQKLFTPTHSAPHFYSFNC